MQSVTIALSLCALLGCGLASQPSTPTNAAKDYTFTYREPEGCTLAGDNCTYFVGIQLNTGDCNYLDFYLEGVAAAWVAIGFSTTANMFDADVLGCVVVGEEVGAVDTWNVASPNRNNELDNTQTDIIQNAASFTNGRITCNFTRLIAVTNAGQDLDLLAQAYWHLYGLGQNAISTGNLPRALNTHRPQGNPTISGAVVDLGITIPCPCPCPCPCPTAPTNPPEDYCYIYSEPDGCTLNGGNCTYFVAIQENEGNPNYLDFYLEGVAVAWVAIGFSMTANMFDADVLGCVVVGTEVGAVDTWNVASPNRNNILDGTQNDIIQFAASSTNGRIICSFARRVAVTNEGQDLNLLAQNYWLLYGLGQNAINMGTLPRAFNTHRPQNNPTISGSVVNLGITPTVPTNSPENYTYTYRQPDGCTLAGGNCTYFVAIQKNEGSRKYLDFYLVGVAAAWVAIGFSTTASMFDADVLGCVVVGTEIRAVDTWNVASPVRNNVLDDTQYGITQFEASSTNGRIICSFTRKVAVTNEGQDLNLLAQDYWLLYGLGQNAISTGVLPRAFNTHRPQNNPTISGAVVNLDITPTAPTNSPEDYTYTYRQPDGCTLAGGDCNYFVAIQTNEDNSKYLDFYLVGVAAAWVAIGFSTTANMFDADVLGCVVVGIEVRAVDTWNIASPRRNNVLDDTQYGITQFAASSTDGRITCSFARRVAVTNVGQDLNLLAQDYWLLYGLGQNAISTGTLPRAFNTHRPDNNPTVSDTVVNISSGQAVRALSLLMITTMSVVAVTAAFFAA